MNERTAARYEEQIRRLRKQNALLTEATERQLTELLTHRAIVLAAVEYVLEQGPERSVTGTYGDLVRQVQRRLKEQRKSLE